MTYRIGRLLARHTPLIALLIGTGIPCALAQPLEQPEAVIEMPRPASRLAGDSAAGEPQAVAQPQVTGQARAGGQSLNEFEKMDLYHRRFTAAANNMAQLFKQLNQKIEEVSLAAKTVEAKDSSHNRRQLEAKLRQLENVRQSYSVQYSQLQSQMQNEYRNYAALSNNVRAKYKIPKDSKSLEDASLDSASAKVESEKNKSSGTKEAKNAKDTKAGNVKARQPQAEEPPSVDEPAKDPRVMDMDTQELRERRDGKIKPSTSNSEPVQAPTLGIVR